VHLTQPSHTTPSVPFECFTEGFCTVAHISELQVQDVIVQGHCQKARDIRRPDIAGLPYVCRDLWVYVCGCMCVCVCLCVCVCACVCICIYVHVFACSCPVHGRPLLLISRQMQKTKPLRMLFIPRGRARSHNSFPSLPICHYSTVPTLFLNTACKNRNGLLSTQ